MIRLLFLGDVVGEPGRNALFRFLETEKEARYIDFVIVNGENAANGRGITPKIAVDLLRAGVAVITTGDHVWDQREITSFIETEPRLLRPINYPDRTPGAGSVTLDTAKGPIAVINAQCRTFLNPPLENPFIALEHEVERLRERTPVIFVDIHGETTSEKIAVGRLLDGRVSAVVGTHTHVQTADERIFPNGTAFLCDAGMCGAEESILGREIPSVVGRFLTAMPAQLPVAKGTVRVCGAEIDVDEATGRALAIRRVSALIEQQVQPPVPEPSPSVALV